LEYAAAEGWIKKEFCGLSGQGWKRHKYIPQIPQKALTECKHLPTKGTDIDAEGTDIGAEKALTPRQSKSKKNSKGIMSGKPDPVPSDCKNGIPFQDIISFLNAKTGKNFRATTKATRRHISGRWSEGYRLDDFKAVIMRKTKQWANDAKMAGYLRPETLFGTKFESYLNERDPQPVNDGPDLQNLNEVDIYAN